jgi:DNA-binding NtrC family response regulator
MRILIVDDDRALAGLLKDHCAERGHAVDCIDEASRCLSAVDSLSPDFVFLDVRMRDGNGLELLATLKERFRGTPVAIMTGFEPLASASHASARGAEYFLRKPFGLDELDGVLEAAERRIGERAPAAPAPESGPLQASVAFVGASRAMLEVCRAIGLAAASRVSTLVEGESGVGKDLAARAIHALGGATRPFAAVDCTTIVETLFESELFGHEKGAFTGAHAMRHGKVEAAQGGVLFLDEIAELTPRMQSKLLRLLQMRTFERVGGSTPIQVDFQLVAATNRDLATLVREGRFRADLHYRLNVHRIVIPPLRDRREDIPALVAHFVRHAAERTRMPEPRLAPAAMALLCAHDWPGNVRELENVVTRLVLNAGGRAIGKDDVAPGLSGTPATVPRRTLAQIERDAILATLEATAWNYGETCEILGISRPTLRRKIRGYGLTHP